jgi:hypothetical protein
MDNDQTLKDKILHELETYYYDDIVHNMNSRRNYKLTSDVMEVMGHVALIFSIIISFSAGYFKYEWLSFLSGCTGVVSVGLFRFSTYTLKESKERTLIVNTILKSLNMNEIVDIAMDISNDNKKDLKKVTVDGEDEKEETKGLLKHAKSKSNDTSDE